MRRAFSLLEVLVAAGLALLVLVLLAELFLPSLWLYQKEQAQSEVHQSALLLQQKLEREFSNTCLETVTILPVGNDWLLSWASVDSYNPATRGPLYDREGQFSLACYRAATRQFQFGKGKHEDIPLERFGTDSSQAPRLSNQQLQEVFANSGKGKLTTPLRTLVRNLAEFSVSDKDDDTDFAIFFPPLQFHMVTRAIIPAPTSTTQPRQEQAELTCKLTPRVRRW